MPNNCSTLFIMWVKDEDQSSKPRQSNHGNEVGAGQEQL